MIYKSLIINTPKQAKIIIWKKNNYNKIIIFNNSKKFILINSNYINFDKWNNNIIIINSFIINNTKINNKINNFVKSWNLYFFKKIKFKGKGFRIKSFKKINLIKFYFGKSHKTFILFRKIKYKRINKYKFLFKSINKNKLLNLSIKTIKIKKINYYTLRGLRLSRQIIFKRKGKKGTYI